MPSSTFVVTMQSVPDIPDSISLTEYLEQAPMLYQIKRFRP
jgi:hypothetical protein